MKDVPGFDFDSAAYDTRDHDGFADNVNVIASPGGRLTMQQVKEMARRELAMVGARHVKVARFPNDVDGTSAAHVSATMSVNGNEYVIEQFYPSSSQRTFVVTFSFSPQVSSRQRTKVAGATLASWSWN